jgi:hypothetical protein
MTTHYSLHVLDGAAASEMRKMVTSMKGGTTGPKARKPFDEVMENVPAASGMTYEAATGMTYEAATVGEVGGVWCRAPVSHRPDRRAGGFYRTWDSCGPVVSSGTQSTHRVAHRRPQGVLMTTLSP